MLFYINAKPDEAVELVPNENKTALKLKKKASGGYDYEFGANEFIVNLTSNQVEFSLDATGINVHKAFIKEFCYSNPMPGRVEAYDPTDTTGNTPFDPSQKPTRIGFKVNIRDRELIQIGVIVAIEETSGARHKHILCDPQVGNGPGN